MTSLALSQPSRISSHVNRRWLTLLVLLGSSFCLLWQLDAKSLWIDELFTAEIVAQPTVQRIIAAVRATEGRPPLYYLLLHFWTRFAGTSDFALRFFSIAPAFLCLPLVYGLARRLSNRQIAWSTFLLFAFAPLFLLYARMARAYFMAVCWALLTCYCFIRWLDRPESLWWGGYLLAGWGLLYTDYMTASILLIPNLILVSFWRNSRYLWGRWAAIQVLLILGFIPWLPSLLQHTARYQTPIRLADLTQGISGYAVKLAQPVLVFSLGETLHPWNPIGGLGLLMISGLALLGLWQLWRQRQLESWFIIFSVIIPVLFTVFIVTGFLVRYMTFAWIGARTLQAFPFYVMLVAAGISALKSPTMRRLVLGFIAVVFLYANVNDYTNRDFQNPVYVIPSKTIAAHIVTQIQPGDAIIASRDSIVERYYRAYRMDYPILDSQMADELRTSIEQNQYTRLWLVTVNRDRGGVEPDPNFMTWLQTQYVTTGHWGYAEVTPGYRRFKMLLTQREAYRYKAELTLYVRRQSALP
ncbi:MAG TPA: glycosyltransferase family 39 protein [Anaerolineae bacterium]|nr:glycosyltransferase family 39 protein [Anaerolineae bacterium]HQK12438.1 glycosyltransferase family 39 protein [Anaerolineae bacterium]